MGKVNSIMFWEVYKELYAADIFRKFVDIYLFIDFIGQEGWIDLLYIEHNPLMLNFV